MDDAFVVTSTRTGDVESIIVARVSGIVEHEIVIYIVSAMRMFCKVGGFLGVWCPRTLVNNAPITIMVMRLILDIVPINIRKPIGFVAVIGSAVGFGNVSSPSIDTLQSHGYLLCLKWCA